MNSPNVIVEKEIKNAYTEIKTWSNIVNQQIKMSSIDEPKDIREARNLKIVQQSVKKGKAHRFRSQNNSFLETAPHIGSLVDDINRFKHTTKFVESEAINELLHERNKS